MTGIAMTLGWVATNEVGYLIAACLVAIVYQLSELRYETRTWMRNKDKE